MKVVYYFCHEECGDGSCQKVLREQVHKGEDHQVEDRQRKLVAVKQEGVKRVTAI
jgi:hypothetical protein